MITYNTDSCRIQSQSYKLKKKNKVNPVYPPPTSLSGGIKKIPKINIL